MTVCFTKNDNLILLHFNMKKLNMFNFLNIKMMKNFFEIIRHHCFVLVTTRNLHTCVCFYVNICLNKNKSQVLYNKTWRSFLNIGRNKIYKIIGKKYLSKWLLKLRSNPVKTLSASKIELWALSRWLFSQKAPSEVFDWVLNTPLRSSHRRCSVKKVFL